MEACAPQGRQPKPQAAKPGKKRNLSDAFLDKAGEGAAVPKGDSRGQEGDFLEPEWAVASLPEADLWEGQPADLQAFQEPEGGSGNG